MSERLRNIERSFPLTPMQKGMIFHRLLDEQSAVDVQQLICTFAEPIDSSTLESAWRHTVERQPVLRTGFRWDGSHEPAQDVHQSVDVHVQKHDWSGETDEEAERRFDAYLAADRKRSFDLRQAPLVRAVFFMLPGGRTRFLLSSHHALLDTPSLDRLIADLLQTYDAIRAGELPVDARPPSFAAFVDWLREHDHAAAERFWRERLRGFTAPTPLPAHADGGAREDDDLYGDLTIELSTGLRHSLVGIVSDERVSLDALIVASWSLLLSRYSGEDEVVSGVARSIRPSGVPDIDLMLGLFVNTVPARVRVEQEESVRALIERVRNEQDAARAHQHAPLVSIQQWSDADHGTSLFETLLILEESELGASTNGRAELRLIERTGYPVTVTASLAPSLSLKLSWDRRRVDDETMRRVSAHLVQVLDAFARDPSQSISSVSLLNEEERRRQVVEWNDTRRDYPRTATVESLFEMQAAATPDRVALVFAGEELTYRELSSRANRLARRLRDQGADPGSLVGILMERSVDLVVGLLAILKSGSAYVPLDPTYPRERLEFMLQDSAAAVLLTQPELAGLLTPPHAKVVSLERGWERNGEESDERIDGLRRADQLAYVIYTSGSTGKPKGVQIEQRSLVNFLFSMREEPGLAAGDVLLAVTTISFDIAGLEIWLPLISGARLELASREVAADGRRLITAIERSGATILQATPATFRMLLEGGWRGDRRIRVLCGGEALPRDLADRILEQCGSLWNMYGPTETTIWSSLHRVERGETGAVSIGRPIANTQIYLLDPTLRPVPIGVAGELHIGGDGVARGYFNRPELTAEKFIPDPFSPDPPARLYKTGDAARYRADGAIEYLHRLDNQVKLRGFRIETGEIEAALRRHASVSEAVVVLRSDVPGGSALVAYLVPKQSPPPSAELRDVLSSTLPQHMVPSFFVFLDRFPLTPNGKIDRRSLPPPERAQSAHQERVEPRDDLEKRLGSIWCEVLELPSIGIDDNFFDLGGESLLAVQMFVRIEDAFERQLPLATLFTAPTIRQLAERLREEGWSAPWSPLIAIQPRGSATPFFCIHGVGGNVLNYRPLATHLGDDQPFYGLQSRGLGGNEAPLTKIEEMAALYLTEIRKVQAHGPYFLGGASFGGVVAFEMAQQLTGAGEEVALVALFDTNPVNYGEAAASVDAEAGGGFLHRMKIHLGVLRRGPDRFGYFRKKARRVRRRIIYRSWQTIYGIFQRVSRPLPSALQNVQQANYKALRDYVPSRYPGKVVLFYAAHEPAEFTRDKQRGWSVLAAGGVASHEVPGDHITMVEEPNVIELAQALRPHLGREGE